MEYGEFKAVINIKDKNGEDLIEYTTWRSDYISAIINSVPVKFDVAAEEKATITISLNKNVKMCN